MNALLEVTARACIAQRMNALLEVTAMVFMLSARPCTSAVDRVQPYPPHTPHHTAFTLYCITSHHHLA
jgi:hypothetical protein